MAARHPPARVGFLLVDFKGGAAFAPLAGLPHVVATLSDLDDRLAARAVESLRAELRRRERLLARHAARSIDELPSGVLARLVVVVDEFAAVVAEHPELHPVFADLAARGRSLGLHLVLCTQRPAGVVRDVVLANVTLRIALRVTDRHDSIAVVGTDAASRLPLDPRGRAILAGPQGEPRLVQLAIAGADDIERILRSVPAGPLQERTWCDPLPRRIPLDSLPRPATGGLAFGLADLPAEQRQPVAVHEPSRHGALLVLGASASGKTTTLATLAESAGGARWLPPHPPDAWQVLTESLARPGDGPGLLLIDDLDLLLARFDPEYRGEVLDLVTRLAREGARSGPQLVASTQSVSAALAPVVAAFGSRLLLRLATREEHLLAGGGAIGYDADAPPGYGSWRGMSVQVAIGRAAPADIESPAPAAIELRRGEVTAVVAGQPAELRAALAAAGARVIDLDGVRPDGASSDGDALSVTGTDAPTVLLGDPDAWTAAWALLTRARREWQLVLVGCTVADHRALTRARELPPPLDERAGECWLVRDGVTRRAVLRLDPLPASSAQARPAESSTGVSPCASATGPLTTAPACMLSPRARAASARERAAPADGSRSRGRRAASRSSARRSTCCGTAPGMFGDAVEQRAVHGEGRVGVRRRAGVLEAAALVDGDVDEHAARLHPRHEVVADQLRRLARPAPARSRSRRSASTQRRARSRSCWRRSS